MAAVITHVKQLNMSVPGETERQSCVQTCSLWKEVSSCACSSCWRPPEANNVRMTVCFWLHRMEMCAPGDKPVCPLSDEAQVLTCSPGSIPSVRRLKQTGTWKRLLILLHPASPRLQQLWEDEKILSFGISFACPMWNVHFWPLLRDWTPLWDLICAVACRWWFSADQSLDSTGSKPTVGLHGKIVVAPVPFDSGNTPTCCRIYLSASFTPKLRPPRGGPLKFQLPLCILRT